MAEPAKVQESAVHNDFEDFFDKNRDDEATDAVIESVTDVEWVSVREAANVLGISERSVFRRIKNNKLQKKEEDGRTYVAIDRPEIIMPDSDNGQNEDRQGDSHRHNASVGGTDTEANLLQIVSDLNEKMSDLTDKLVQASGRAGYMEANNADLRRELEAKSEAMKLLEDKQAKADKESKQLQEVQHHYAVLEDEKNIIESKYREAQKKIERMELLQNRSTWKKFSDWMMGKS